jgi:hypothetical protein
MIEKLDSADVKAEGKEEGLVKVIVSFPKEGHTLPEAYTNHLSMIKHLGHLQERGKLLKQIPRFEFFLVTFGRMFTPVAREEAAKLAVESEADYLFMMDDDMIVPDDLFEKLYRHNVDIVAPLAFTRNPPHLPVLYSSIEGWDSVTGQDTFQNHHVKKYPKNKLVECDAVGFGSVLIKTEVLKKTPRPRFQSTTGTGEDVYFCYLAKRHGAKVFMDTSTKLGHLGHPMVIDEVVHEKWREVLEPDFDKKNGEYDKYEAKVILGD